MRPQELPFFNSPVRNNSVDELIIYADGASQGNPGEAGAGIVFTDAQGKILKEEKYFLGKTTNNAAEYKALILALEKARQFKPKLIKIFMDSELIVRQLQGEYKVRNLGLKALHEEVRKLLPNFPKYIIKYIEREKNKRADKLAKEAIFENFKKPAENMRKGVG